MYVFYKKNKKITFSKIKSCIFISSKTRGVDKYETDRIHILEYKVLGNVLSLTTEMVKRIIII